MSRVNIDGTCECDCHEPGTSTMHIRPCCVKCLHCGKNIQHGAMEAHQLICLPRTDENHWFIQRK